MRFPQADLGELNVFERQWPIGSVFCSVTATDPALLLGFGAWEAFAAGRVLVGFDAGQPEFDALEETGGSKEVTLTAAQSGLPQHAHVQTVNSTTTGPNLGYGLDTSTNNGVAADYSTQDAGPADAAEAHSNLQPFITVRFWKRIG